MSAPATAPRHGVIAPVLFGGSRTRPPELPPYATFFGFIAPPFDLTLDPRFVYLGASHARARAEILDGLQRREGVMVLTGASGTGKTTLCRWTLQSVPAPTFASIVVDPLITPHELLVQVLSDFGVISTAFAGGESVSHIGCHELTLVLRRFLDSLVPSGARALIVIDDAHQVSTAVLAQLRVLSNFETATAKQLQIILIGQPGLETTLETAELDSLRQRVSRQCRLEPLSMEEMAAFVEHRLEVALGRPAAGDAGGLVPENGDPSVQIGGADARVSFSRASLAVCARLSNGVPRELTRLCDRTLEIAAARQVRRIRPEQVFQAARRLNLPVRFTDRIRIGRSAVMLAAAACLAAAFWGLWLSGRSRAVPEAPVESAEPASARTAVPTRQTPASAALSVGETPASLPGVPARGSVSTPLAAAESFVLLVASFRNEEGAREARQQLVERSLPAFVREDGRWHVVFVGPYGSRPEADAALSQVDRSAFADARVVKAN